MQRTENTKHGPLKIIRSVQQRRVESIVIINCHGFYKGTPNVMNLFDGGTVEARSSDRNVVRQRHYAEPTIPINEIRWRRHRFDIVLVAAFDRVARSVRHFLEVLDELAHLGIEFVSLRENIDTGGPLGRAMVVMSARLPSLKKV